MEPHQVIADRFEIQALIGSGGMGDVFKAVDRLTGGHVAIKVLHGSMPRDAERFRREAHVLAELSHPRVVKYVAHGVTPANKPYIAMEWLDGQDLSERLAKTGVTISDSIIIGKRVAEGLSVLHEKGFVHRDVKPSNLFLLGDDVAKVKLLDLGIARSTNPTRFATKSGVTVGTPGYMAPEQARGARDLDARVDVFALGCVLYECLTGRPAFTGDNMAALLAKILLEPSPRVRDSNPEVPDTLDDLVARMLAKAPAERPANGAAVLRELEALRYVASPVDSSRRASLGKTRVLTGDERRLISVIMAHSGASPQDTTREREVVLSDETIEAPFDPRTIVASFGASAEWLVDGSLVVTVSGRGTASDQAAHAARCALALRPHLLDATVVLATGFATVTERSPLGEVIDRAGKVMASLRQMRGSAPGWDTAAGFPPIFLDETTAGLLDMRFDIGGDERGLFIRGLREREGSTRTLLGKSTSCVGRDRELSTLMGLLEECASEPVARAVLVTAPAGVGKSRLGQEFIRAARDAYREAEIWVARGDPMSQGSPFAMLARGVRRACGAAEGEALVVRQHKLRARLGRHLSGESLVRVSEFLGELAGTPFTQSTSVQLRAARQDAILMGDQMTRAWEDWVAAECAVQPVLLVLEDLQWGDLPSIKILDSVLRNLTDKPFMVLAFARPEVHEVFPNLWEERSLQEIRLGPLMKRAGERLVREVLGDDVAPEIVARLVDRAAGNAFYLEELVRAHVEGRKELPETVLAMVEARLENLDPAARRLLRAASIFGETFWRGGIATMLGGDFRTNEVDDWLEELQHREIVGRKADSRFPRDQEFVFRHGLVREAAYAMLTAQDRSLGHRLAGEWLERAGETEPVVLGEHFERGGVGDRAAEWYRRAARDAIEGNDFELALDRAERALACGGADGPGVGEIRLMQAEAHAWQGRYAEGAAFAEQALAALERGSDAWFDAAGELANACWRLGKAERVRALGETIRALDPDPKPSPSRVIGTARVAQRLIFVGQFHGAEPMVRWLEDLPVPEDEPAVRAWIHAARAVRAMWLGESEEEVRALHAAVDGFELAGDRRNACVHRQNAGHCLIALGALEEAEKVQRQVVEAAEHMGLRALANTAKQSLGIAIGRQGRFTEALQIQRDAMAGFVAIGNSVWEGISLVYLALVLRLAGQAEEAEQHVRRGLEMVGTSPPLRASALSGLALVLLERGKVEEAHRYAKESFELFKSLGGLVEGEALLRLTLAETYNAMGDRVSAKEVIREARDLVLSRAQRIKLPEWRAAFLEKIRENEKILIRAKEWLVEPN